MKQWWRGTFPAWLVAGLMSGVLFFTVRFINTVDALVKGETDREIRLQLLERQTAEISTVLKSLSEEIRQLNRDRSRLN